MAKYITILVSCLLLSLTNLNSQPTITVDFPSVGATNISLMPVIKVHVGSSYKIDSSCLNYTGMLPDSNWDSTRNRWKITPIYVFQSPMYDGSDSSLQLAEMFCPGEKCTLLDDSTFEFINTGRFNYETQYGLYFDDLRAIDTITGDTITFDTIINPLFTTTKPMYRVENISSAGNDIRTGDTISVQFNRDLLSAITPLGPVLTLSKLDTTTINDTTYYIFVDVPSQSFIGDSQNIACIIPDTNYTIGNEYYLNVHLYRLTGDSADNFTNGIKLKQKSMVNTMVRNLDSTDTLSIYFCPRINTKTYFLDPQESLALDAPKYDSNYCLVGWECPGYSNLNGNTNNSNTITFAPEQLQDLNITATYAKVHQDTVKLSDTIGGSFTAFTSGTMVNDSVYTLPRRDNNKMLVIANPITGYVFSHWASDDSLLNGSTNPYLDIAPFIKNYRMDSLGNWDYGSALCKYFRPCYAPSPANCQNASICVTVSVEDGSEIFTGSSSVEDSTKAKDLIDYVKIDNDTVNLVGENQTATGCLTIYNPNLPINSNVSVKLNPAFETKYEIAYYYDVDNKFGIKFGRKFPDYNNPPNDSAIGLLADPYGDSVGTQFTQPVVLDEPDRCHLNLKVIIYRRRCYLSTEMMMADTSELPYDNVVNMSFNGTHPGSIANTNLGNNRRNQWEWTVLDTDLKSTIFKKVTWYKIVPYGDTVYLKGEILLKDRGIDSAYWYGEDGYVNTPIIDSSLVLIMTGNVKTLYDIPHVFWLLSIAFDDCEHQIGRWYDVIKGGYPITHDQVCMSENITRSSYYPNVHDDNHSEESGYQFKTGKIYFQFSRDVDPNSLVDPNCPEYDDQQVEIASYLCKGHGLQGYDLDPGMGTFPRNYPWEYPKSPRYDGQPLKNYYYNSLCSTQGKEVTFTFISPNGFGFPHMSDFGILVTNNIKSIYGEKLNNPGKAQFSTEYPSIEVRLINYHCSPIVNNIENILKYYIILSLGAVLKNYKYVTSLP